MIIDTTGLSYNVSEINANWKIKVSGKNYEGAKLNTLVGVSGLIKLIGEELADKLIKRAFRDMNDVCICKLRRGLKVSFYAF